MRIFLTRPTPPRRISIWRLVVCAILCAILLMGHERAVAQKASSKVANGVENATSAPIDSGFLFIEGRYISPPYVFRSHEGEHFVSDVALTGVSLAARDDNDRNPQGKNGRSNPNAWRKISRELEGGGVVVLLARGKPIVLNASTAGYALLKVLSGDVARRHEAFQAATRLHEQMDPQSWQSTFDAFEATTEFLARAKAEVHRFDEIEAANLASNAAVHRLNATAYPLTIIGMGIVVLAFGHLLSHRPAADEYADETLLSPEVSRVVCRSLILILILSALDLAWTLLASQAGSMRELNPLGSRLIEDPKQLIAFKLVATSLSVGLLFVLRRNGLARRAAWWSCLICTLLAVRWLTFNSMFTS